MELVLNVHTTLEEIGGLFQESYPHLKLGFYPHNHNIGEGSLEKELSPSTTIGNLNDEFFETNFHAQGNTKVKTFEQELSDIIGCSIQVFRKSGNVWIQTTTTDEWTLHHQEEIAI